MQNKPDAQLIREYAEDGDESAFREIVVRHTDLIYSSALRQTNCPDLASDVIQGVFTDLARKAPALAKSLDENASLLGWLYRSTRFAALTQMRNDRRRQDRERQAMENLDPAPETALEWERIRPVLDDAMAELSEADRDALLLRFFKNQDFRAVGASLGVSNDTAQKRVSRALDRLRAGFTRRGVTTSALALATALSANAVSLAPAGLTASLATTALASASAATTVTATITKTIAMTTLQKALITAVAATVIGAGIYGAHHVASLRNELEALQQQQATLNSQLDQLRHERDDATNRLATTRRDMEQSGSSEDKKALLKLRAEVVRLRGLAGSPTEVEANALSAKVGKLKQRLEKFPEAKIPELQLLSEEDWLFAAKGKLDTDADYRRALAALRNAAGDKFVGLISPAVNQFAKANNGQFPTDLSQLGSFLNTPMDDSIMQRWEVAPAQTVKNVSVGGDFIITQKAAPVDDLFDSRFVIGVGGYGSTDYLSADAGEALTPVYQAYNAANSGQTFTDPAQLLPYATTPDQQAWIQKLIQRDALGK